EYCALLALQRNRAAVLNQRCDAVSPSWDFDCFPIRCCDCGKNCGSVIHRPISHRPEILDAHPLAHLVLRCANDRSAIRSPETNETCISLHVGNGNTHHHFHVICACRRSLTEREHLINNGECILVLITATDEDVNECRSWNTN